MKTIFKSALVACVALTTMLAGCSKEQGVDSTGNLKTVSIKISRGDITKAPGLHVENGDEVIMSEGALYFTEGTKITRMYSIVPGNDATIEDGTVGIDALSEGLPFVNLPEVVSDVYFVANSPIGYNVADITEFHAVTVADLGNQRDVADVAIYGTSNGLQNHIVGEDGANDTYTASIEAKPIVARFEIGSIVGNYPNDIEDPTNPAASRIVTYDLLGIYVDNYYTNTGLNGAKDEGNFIPGTNLAVDYPGTHSQYLMDNSSESWDTEDNYTYTPAVEIPEPGDGEDPAEAVWGYNLLAAADAAPMPTIVVKVENVVVLDAEGNEDTETYQDVRFFTVRNIKNASGAIISNLAQGNVYRIVELSFSEKHLTPNPNVGLVDITVDVNIMNWVSQDVGYEF